MPQSRPRQKYSSPAALLSELYLDSDVIAPRASCTSSGAAVALRLVPLERFVVHRHLFHRIGEQTINTLCSKNMRLSFVFPRSFQKIG